MELTVHQNTELPKNGSKIIINWGDSTYVGVFRENERFTDKKVPVVIIHYNSAAVPWSTVKQWVYVDEVFGFKEHTKV